MGVRFGVGDKPQCEAEPVTKLGSRPSAGLVLQQDALHLAHHHPQWQNLGSRTLTPLPEGCPHPELSLTHGTRTVPHQEDLKILCF